MIITVVNTNMLNRIPIIDSLILNFALSLLFFLYEIMEKIKETIPGNTPKPKTKKEAIETIDRTNPDVSSDSLNISFFISFLSSIIITVFNYTILYYSLANRIFVLL